MPPDDIRPIPADQLPVFDHSRPGRDASLVAMRSAWIDFYDADYDLVVRFLMRTGARWDDARDAAQRFRHPQVIPRPAIDRYLNTDPARYAREQRKARSLLFVAATRARDELSITWHDAPSRFLPQ